MPGNTGIKVIDGDMIFEHNGNIIATLGSGGLTFETGKTISAPTVKVGTAAVANGTQVSKISDPAAGGVIDAEARTAINAIIDALEAYGIAASS